MWWVSTSPGGRMCLFNMWPSSAWRGITGLEAVGLEEAVLHEGALPWQPRAWVRGYGGVSARCFFLCVCVEEGSVIRLNSNWQFRSGTLLSHGFSCAGSREPSCTKRLFYCMCNRKRQLVASAPRTGPVEACSPQCTTRWSFSKQTRHTTLCADFSQTKCFVSKVLCSSKSSKKKRGGKKWFGLSLCKVYEIYGF